MNTLLRLAHPFVMIGWGLAFALWVDSTRGNLIFHHFRPDVGDFWIAALAVGVSLLHAWIMMTHAAVQEDDETLMSIYTKVFCHVPALLITAFSLFLFIGGVMMCFGELDLMSISAVLIGLISMPHFWMRVFPE